MYYWFVLVYLLRHAIALPRGTHGVQDKDRPLTEKGRKRMEQEAVGICRIAKTFDVILTSPYKRAYETAMITAHAMGRTDALRICDALKPGTPYKTLVNALASYADRESMLLVGHEPDMSLITAMLINMPEPNIDFKKGSLCCIEIDGIPLPRPGVLRWLLKPAQLRDLGSR